MKLEERACYIQYLESVKNRTQLCISPLDTYDMFSGKLLADVKNSLICMSVVKITIHIFPVFRGREPGGVPRAVGEHMSTNNMIAIKKPLCAPKMHQIEAH